MQKIWDMRRKGTVRSVSCVLDLLSSASKSNLKDVITFKFLPDASLRVTPAQNRAKLHTTIKPSSKPLGYNTMADDSCPLVSSLVWNGSILNSYFLWALGLGQCVREAMSPGFSLFGLTLVLLPSGSLYWSRYPELSLWISRRSWQQPSEGIKLQLAPGNVLKPNHYTGNNVPLQPLSVLSHHGRAFTVNHSKWNDTLFGCNV